MGIGLAAARNLLKACLLAIALCVSLGAMGWALGGYRIASIFVFCGALLLGLVLWSADRLITGLGSARELLPAEAPGLHSALDRLTLQAGVARPRLYLIADVYPRALAAGRGGRGSVIGLSSGLLAVAAPAEIEGILAHEVAHLRNGDLLVQTTAAVLAAAIVETSRIGGFLQRALLFLLGPVAAAFVHLLLSPKREFEADLLAAAWCGSPHGLADALVRLELAREAVSLAGTPTLEPLHTASPYADEGFAALFATHPPVEQRVRRLRALDPGWSERRRAA